MNTREYLAAVMTERAIDPARYVITFDADEEAITIVLDGIAYTMHAGSDDDDFIFIADDRAPIIIPLPDFILDAGDAS